MKKSKLMKALLVFGMSMVTATSIVGFTACGDECDHVDEDNNGKCDICNEDMPSEGGEQGGGETVTVAVEKVELNKSSLTLDIGDEETLTATVTPDNADNKTVTWTSNKPEIATVSDSGKVTAKAAGTATITATAGGKTATCSVTVNEPVPQPEVTAEEWAAILESVHNFTLTESADGETGAIKVDGEKVAFDDDRIYVKDGEHYYLYYHEGDTEEWTKEEIEDQDYDEYVGPFVGIVGSFKDLYEEFEINDDGVYVAKEAIDMTDTLDTVFENVQITFDNGKLLGIKFEIHADMGEEGPEDGPNEGAPTEQADEPTEGGETTETPDPTEDPTVDPTDKIIINYEITDVGTTTVDLPKIEGEEGGITEEEWAEIFGSIDNFTMAVTLDDQNALLKVDGNKISEDDTKIYVKDGENYYLYTYENDAWTKADSNSSTYENQAFAITVVNSFKDIYEEFTYTDGAYVVEDIFSTVLNFTIIKAEITLDNGKLSSIKFDVEVGTPESPATVTYEVTDIGSTNVTLPTVGGEHVKVDVEKVELNKNTLTLEVGGEETLTATVTPDNADDKTVTWTSSDPSVATVDNSGKVTAVAAGTATITATADGKSATCSVTVNATDPDDEGIKLTFSNVTRYGGANNDENVEMTVKYDIGEEALLMGADNQFDAAYINGTLNADTGWADEGTPEGKAHQAHLWLRGFKAEYDTKYVITLKLGDTVVATGTLLIETPKSMSVSSESESLKGTALTLEPEDVVMLEASVTGKFPEGAAYKWEITEGADYIELEEDEETAMITAKAYTGEDNLTAKVKVTYGVDGTTVSKVISVTVKGTKGDEGDDGVETLAVTNVRTDGAVYLMATMNKHLDFSYIKTSCQDDETHNTPTQNTGNNRWESSTSTVFIFAPNADFTPTVSGYVYLIEFYDADGNLIARAEVTCP